MCSKFSSSQDNSGTTLMDLITSDPSSTSTSSQSTPVAPPALPPQTTAAAPPSASTDRKKKGTLMQIQSDTISAAKAVRANIMPQKQKRKPVSYAQLARSIHELAATSDQKNSQRQLVHHVFPKLAVYNSVDPSLAPSLLMLDQQCEDRTVLRYVYYYLARILSDSGSQGVSSGGGIPTPNWDALADIDAVGGVTRADVVPRIVDRLTSEALNEDIEFHARRLQALKALTYAPSSSPEISEKLYEIVFGILDKVADTPQKRKKGILGTKGGDKESTIRSNLQYAALSALRRLPLDPGNPAFLHRSVQGVSFADPVAVRYSLEILSDLATSDPYAVAMALGPMISDQERIGYRDPLKNKRNNWLRGFQVSNKQGGNSGDISEEVEGGGEYKGGKRKGWSSRNRLEAERMTTEPHLIIEENDNSMHAEVAVPILVMEEKIELGEQQVSKQITLLGDPTPIQSVASDCSEETEGRANAWVQHNILSLSKEFGATFEGCTKEAQTLLLKIDQKREREMNNNGYC
ncbi:hypothetical protein FXO37_35116 [Capsicum annuum]|nr:hypothetical protein FXO37_35116 [Capsicum annuum]